MVLYVAVFLTPLLLMFLFVSVKMLPQYQRGVVIRLGKLRVPKVPGLVVLIPLLKNIIRVDLRTKTHDVPGQDIITKNNVSVREIGVSGKNTILLPVFMDLLKNFMFKGHFKPRLEGSC
jgi:regulator of protease activity HflC (stomatin/prohibitin superfamily)